MTRYCAGVTSEAAGAILADPNHQAAAAGAREALWLDHALDARQMGGKGARGAASSLPGRRAAGAARAIILAFLDFGDCDLDVFQNELQLIGIEFLRTLARARSYSLTSNCSRSTVSFDAASSLST
jgi:hypothetical protein